MLEGTSRIYDTKQRMLLVSATLVPLHRPPSASLQVAGPGEPVHALGHAASVLGCRAAASHLGLAAGAVLPPGSHGAHRTGSGAGAAGERDVGGGQRPADRRGPWPAAAGCAGGSVPRGRPHAARAGGAGAACSPQQAPAGGKGWGPGAILFPRDSGRHARSGCWLASLASQGAGVPG